MQLKLQTDLFWLYVFTQKTLRCWLPPEGSPGGPEGNPGGPIEADELVEPVLIKQIASNTVIL